jgi:hypothetical protein
MRRRRRPAEMNHEGSIARSSSSSLTPSLHIRVHLATAFTAYGSARTGNVKFVSYKEGEKVHTECSLRVGYD